MKILTFGELLLRLASPGYSRLFQKDSLETSFCGSEANVAVSLAIFGLESMFITKLPNTIVGHAAVNSMRYFGVDTSKIVFGDGRMGLYYLEKGVSQRATKVTYDRTNSAVAMAEPSDFDWDKVFHEVQWFHWSGINPALSDNMFYICLEACKKAKEKGITVSCDLNYRKMLWSSETAQSVMSKLMPYIDVCMANEEDTEKVLGIIPPSNDIESGNINKRGYEYVAKILCQRYGCKEIAITFRKSYSASYNIWSAMLYDSANEQCFYSKEYKINIVDRLGAGDSFSAGIIYGLITGMNCQEIVEFATASSCLKHTIEGDYNNISVSEVMDLMKNGGNGRVKR